MRTGDLPEGKKRDESLDDCGPSAGLGVGACVRPTEREAASTRRDEERSAAPERRREGLQGRAGTHPGAKGKIRSLGRGTAGGRGEEVEIAIRHVRTIRDMRKLCGLFALACFLAAPAFAWQHWGGDRGGTRFSPLA